MAKSYPEEVAKRFARAKPEDFDFWNELDSCLSYAMVENDKGCVTFSNFDSNAIAMAYIFICYGMFELKSTICAMLMPKILFKITSEKDVELCLWRIENETRHTL